MQRFIPLFATLLMACTGSGVADDDDSVSPTPSSPLNPTFTPTPSATPAVVVTLAGLGLTDAQSPTAAPTNAASQTPGDTTATPPQEPTDAPTPTPPPSPTATPPLPQWWRATVEISVSQLAGGHSCEARLTESGVPVASTCLGCDVAFLVTRSLTSSAGICQWPSNESFELAMFRSAGRMDRLFPAATDEGVDTWQPWYLIEAVGLQEDPDIPGQWEAVYKIDGHPDGGFSPASPLPDTPP